MSRSIFLILGAAGLVLSGAGAAEAARRHKPAPAPVAAPKPPPAAQDDGDDAAPAVAPASSGGLAALSEAEARARLGQPDIARNEGSGAMWTYRLPDCALFVFFRSTAGQPLKVSGVAAGPRRRGQAALPVDTCIAVALQSRAPAPRP